jgi:hypothetical protein
LFSSIYGELVDESPGLMELLTEGSFGLLSEKSIRLVHQPIESVR